MAGYAAVAMGGGNGGGPFIPATLGISLAAGGALSLNQWWERGPDAHMRRTATRPLPRGAVRPGVALTFTLALCLVATLVLALATTLTAAAIALAIIVLYGLIYTPLKRKTVWATEIGSFAGALPPILGAAAAGQPLHPAAWTLAVLLLFWQMPHFYGIGWLYREEYRAAGFRLLPAVDSDGHRTARRSLFYSAALFGFTPLPWLVGPLGPVYGIAATAGAACLLWTAWRFFRAADDRRQSARTMFLSGVLYLPPVLAALVIDQGLAA